MNDNWYKDIMIQRFQLDKYYDPTKLLFVLTLTETGVFEEKYKIDDICRYIRRYYVANPNVAHSNVNVSIRNVFKYGINDIKPVVLMNIKLWEKESQFGSVSHDDHFVYLSLDDYSNDQVLLTRKLCFTLFKKYYKENLVPIDNKAYLLRLNDRKLEFGCSDYKEYALEDFQYCPLSEETDIDKLFVTHIFFRDEGATDEDFLNPTNSLLLGLNEWFDYVSGKFYFDENGRVINKSSSIVSSKMRISLSLIDNERRLFIKKHLESINR